jgi:Zn-finger nucleic acid-binding protein
MSSRKVCLEDFLEDAQPQKNKYNKYNKNHSQTDSVSKNQQEFGQKKRIKP